MKLYSFTALSDKKVSDYINDNHKVEIQNQKAFSLNIYRSPMLPFSENDKRENPH